MKHFSWTFIKKKTKKLNIQRTFRNVFITNGNISKTFNIFLLAEAKPT